MFHVTQFLCETHLKMENKRKKWTAKDNLTAADIKFNEKRKWQLALRRYVIEQKPSYQYAPYFGLDIKGFREWIEIQFIEGMSWTNFGKDWQFGHIIPVNYFDFELEEDLRLCWSFINIQVESLNKEGLNKNEVDILSAKRHFEKLYKETDYSHCERILIKILKLEVVGNVSTEKMGGYLKTEKENMEAFQSLSAEEFSRINTGEKLANIILEKEMLKKFG